MPPRTLRITFSHTSACAGDVGQLTSSSVRPPVFKRWLWQVTQ